jgi:hypothetical protein
MAHYQVLNSSYGGHDEGIMRGVRRLFLFSIKVAAVWGD